MRLLLPFITASFLVFFTSCNQQQDNYIDELSGVWVITAAEIIGNEYEVMPDFIGGMLRLPYCTNFEDGFFCPGSFETVDGQTFELEWIASFSSGDGQRMEIDFTSAPDEEIVVDLLDRPWIVDLSNDDLVLNLSFVTQTGPGIGFQGLASARVEAERR